MREKTYFFVVQPYQFPVRGRKPPLKLAPMWPPDVTHCPTLPIPRQGTETDSVFEKVPDEALEGVQPYQFPVRGRKQ